MMIIIIIINKKNFAHTPPKSQIYLFQPQTVNTKARYKHLFDLANSFLISTTIPAKEMF